ncbi:hypothetical protein AB0J63_32350 [Streptosporangium canum]|uniref:hypothetical protein n=1 Tax=Streptosporangium canum TaxID=324952 RepID=UPI0034499B4B
MITRTEKATSWHDAANSLRSLVNREGYVPIRTRLATEDLDFLEGAREELLGFAALGVRLLDLHQPRDAGGITSDAAHPILRCRSCMWRWPCPTFRAMAESFGSPRTPTSCQHVEPDDGESDEDAQVTLVVPGRPESPGRAESPGQSESPGRSESPGHAKKPGRAGKGGRVEEAGRPGEAGRAEEEIRVLATPRRAVGDMTV